MNEKRNHEQNTGQSMYELACKLYPICRSITGDGVRQSLSIINENIPIQIHEVPSGTEVFDWIVPKEWNIKDAYVIDESGTKVIDFQENNLHIVGYSIPVNKTVTFDELQEHLHSIPEQPDAIPYVTSYYKERWGFCISDNARRKLKKGNYHVVIDSKLEPGSLTYAECYLPGEDQKEIFLSTYICHPSMANNEVSGPVVTTYVVKWLLETRRRYSYRIIFIPETIGSITYLSKHLEEMKKNIVAGFNVTCVGDERAYSYLPTRNGNTLTDKVATYILEEYKKEYITYPFLDRGSDERQYNSPGVDLPVASIMRSKYWEYPEYHTSLDNLSLITPNGLFGSYDVLIKCIELLENNNNYRLKCLCEPQLGKRGLYPTCSNKSSVKQFRNLLNFIAYADGKNDLIDISKIINAPVQELYPIIDNLRKADLLEVL